MGKRKRITRKAADPGHNPADTGVDHNLREGGEEDLNNSYLDKQEARGRRGVDNEDDTENMADQESQE